MKKFRLAEQLQSEPCIPMITPWVHLETEVYGRWNPQQMGISALLMHHISDLMDNCVGHKNYYVMKLLIRGYVPRLSGNSFFFLQISLPVNSCWAVYVGTHVSWNILRAACLTVMIPACSDHVTIYHWQHNCWQIMSWLLWKKWRNVRVMTRGRIYRH